MEIMTMTTRMMMMMTTMIMTDSQSWEADDYGDDDIILMAVMNDGSRMANAVRRSQEKSSSLKFQCGERIDDDDFRGWSVDAMSSFEFRL